MPLKRNEIFEVGQTIGLPYSGSLDEEFAHIGVITNVIRSGHFTPSIVVEVKEQDNNKLTWSMLEIGNFSLYKDEVINDITEK